MPVGASRRPARERAIAWLNGWIAPGTLGGITLGDWLSLLRENRFDVDLPCLPRAAAISCCAAVNTPLRACEEALFGARIAAQQVPAPLFVVGLARSGTTLLHRLLAVDERFATPSFYQVRFPHTFLLTEGVVPRLTAGLLPRKRPMDNVRQGWHAPGEDEGAIALLCGNGVSMRMVFPRRWEHYYRFGVVDELPAELRRAWCAAAVTFAKKLTLRHGRPLLFKTPSHCGRIAALGEHFPGARFVLIHRDPYDVMRSRLRMTEAVSRLRRLQLERPNPQRDAERMLRYYRRLFDKLQQDRQGLAPGQLVEVRFEDLERDPVGQLRAVYEALGLPDFAVVEPALRRYAEGLRGYRKNVHRPLPEPLRQQVAERWRPMFEAWGYPLEADCPDRPPSA